MRVESSRARRTPLLKNLPNKLCTLDHCQSGEYGTDAYIWSGVTDCIIVFCFFGFVLFFQGEPN